MRIDHIFPKSFFEVNHLMKKRIYLIIVSVLLTVAVFLIPILNPGADGMQNKPDDIKRTDTIVNNNKKEKDNTQTPEKINIPKSDTTVVFLVTVSGDSLYDTVQASSGQYKTVYDLLMSKEYRKYTDAVRKSQAIVKASIEKIIPDADFTGSYSYNTVINGFSLRAPYSALEKLNNISGVVSVNPVFTNYLTISEDDEAYDDYQNYDYDYGNDDNYDYDYDNDTEYNTDDYDSSYEDDNYDYTEDDYNYDPDSDEDSEDDSGEGSSESSRTGTTQTTETTQTEQSGDVVYNEDGDVIETPTKYLSTSQITVDISDKDMASTGEIQQAEFFTDLKSFESFYNSSKDKYCLEKTDSGKGFNAVPTVEMITQSLTGRC